MPTDLLKTLAAINADPERSWRNDALNEIVEGHTVDTCYTVDNGWETGINPDENGGGDWVIVESYPSKKRATEGHIKWVAEIRGGRREFPDNQP